MSPKCVPERNNSTTCLWFATYPALACQPLAVVARQERWKNAIHRMNLHTSILAKNEGTFKSQRSCKTTLRTIKNIYIEKPAHPTQELPLAQTLRAFFSHPPKREIHEYSIHSNGGCGKRVPNGTRLQPTTPTHWRPHDTKTHRTTLFYRSCIFEKIAQNVDTALVRSA